MIKNNQSRTFHRSRPQKSITDEGMLTPVTCSHSGSVVKIFFDSRVQFSCLISASMSHAIHANDNNRRDVLFAASSEILLLIIFFGQR